MIVIHNKKHSLLCASLNNMDTTTTLQLVEEDLNCLLFGDYMTPDLEDDEHLYAEVPSVETFSQVVRDCLVEYNQMNKNHMNLVIFR